MCVCVSVYVCLVYRRVSIFLEKVRLKEAK